MKCMAWMMAVALVVGAFVASGIASAADAPAATSSAAAKAAEKAPLPVITIGIVAKSQGNPVFQAAHMGAKDAAKELGAKYGVEVKIDILTPPEEDAQKQAQAIEQLARAGAKGIAVSCSDANAVTPAINKAVELGAVVVCFDSDAPKSKRLCFYGTDDVTCGEYVMKELAAIMGDKGTIAVLAGNQSAPNLQMRVEGVKKELANHKDMKLLPDGVFYHPETPEQASECVNRAQKTNPSIQGWAMIGGWPLFAQNGLKWEPGSVKVVAVDALPPELPYLKNGYVSCLWAQDCYSWGSKSVEILLDKIVKQKDPEGAPRIIAPLAKVTKENADEWAGKWKKWLGQ
jgi:ribose transport system substrate-binding protein